MRIIHKGFSYSHGLEIDGSLVIDSAPGAEKVTNGSFTGAATGWTLTAGWAYSSNTVLKNGDGTTTLSQNVSAIANEIYKLVYTISGWSVGTVTPTLGGVAGTARGADGTYTEYIVATGTGNLIFTPSNTARFTIDTVSVKRVGTAAADRVVAWEDDRGAAAGKGSLFLRAEDGTAMVLGPELLINATAAYGRNTQRLEVNVSADEGGAALNTWSATAAEAAMLDFNRSKSATIGAQSVVASADALGFITFRGSDGAAFIEAAQIRGEVDGTPGTNDMPGRLVFSVTADGAASVTEAMRISSAGELIVGGVVNSLFSGYLGQIVSNTAGHLALATANASASSEIFFHRRRGTFASSAAVQADDKLASIYFTGYTDAYRQSVEIRAEADTGWGATGADTPGRLLILTAPDGSSTPVERQRIDNHGWQSYTMHDNTATPVAATAALKFFAHNKSVVDDGIITLPTVTTNGYGVITADTDAANRTQFFVTSTGTVTLLNNAGSVVANADTDANLCVGTAATQEPLQVKNRLGATKVINILFWYD